LLVGLGGVMVELFNDTRLMPADLAVDAIKDEILGLKASRLLTGYRGADEVDVDAVAAAAAAVGRLMAADPRIIEIDVNPLMAHAGGVVALDALIVTGA
jgi:hypothetical protein